jgi:hypothetical protein
MLAALLSILVAYAIILNRRPVGGRPGRLTGLPVRRSILART